MPVNSQLPYQQLQGDLVSLQSHQNSTAALDSVVWGDRSKDDFNMLAQLQKVSFCLPSISIHESALLLFLVLRRLPRLPCEIWCDLELECHPCSIVVVVYRAIRLFGQGCACRAIIGWYSTSLRVLSCSAVVLLRFRF